MLNKKSIYGATYMTEKKEEKKVIERKEKKRVVETYKRAEKKPDRTQSTGPRKTDKGEGEK